MSAMSADHSDQQQLAARQLQRVNLDLRNAPGEPAPRAKLPRISARPSVPFRFADIFQIAQCLDESDDAGATAGHAANPPTPERSSFLTLPGDQEHQRYLDNVSELYAPEERPRPLAEVLPLPIAQPLRDQLCFEEALLVSLRSDDAADDAAVATDKRLYRCARVTHTSQQ